MELIELYGEEERSGHWNVGWDGGSIQNGYSEAQHCDVDDSYYLIDRYKVATLVVPVCFSLSSTDSQHVSAWLCRAGPLHEP